jgi:hypothetical protein
MSEPSYRSTGRRLRLWIGLGFTFAGLVIFILGVEPGLFGLDRSPVIGFIQIAVFLVGLAFICLGGYISLNLLWNGGEKSIAADIGFRLVSTGYVVSATAGMADVVGFGNHPFPNVPHFGAWQAVGVLLGQAIIVLGFILFVPWRRRPV